MVAIDSTYFSFGSANSSSSAFSSGVGTGCCDWWCFEVILIPPALTVKKIQLKNQITSESKMWLQPSCPRTTSKISGNIFFSYKPAGRCPAFNSLSLSFGGEDIVNKKKYIYSSIIT